MASFFHGIDAALPKRGARKYNSLSTGMACLFRCLTGPYRGKVFPVEAARPLLVGRALEADFTVPDGALEPFHCRIEFEEGHDGHMARVVALRPGRALLVDGVPFDEALLKSGDRVQIGETTLEFREGGAPGDPLGGSPARAGTLCVACRNPIPRLGGGRLLLGQPYCVRCLDLRLIVRRDLGRYRILRKVFRDIAEIVYAAEDLATQPPSRVALHVLKSERQKDPRVLRRFLTKAAFALDLDHPAFARTRDLCWRPERVSFVEDYIDWPSLEERLLAGQTVALHQAARIVLQLVEALRFARRNRMIVGRLRAARLQVADDGTLRIREYWLDPAEEEMVAARIGAPAAPAIAFEPPEPSAVPDYSGASDELSSSGDLLRYVAPDSRDLACYRNEAFEIKPLGILYFQLVTGTAPGEANAQQVTERLEGVFARRRRTAGPQFLPPMVPKLIVRMLDRNPANRYRTLDELARDLKAALQAL